MNREKIIERTRIFWDSKPSDVKNKISRKYNHLFKFNVNWDKPFALLSHKQQNILLKGELIRTYDALSNLEKTKIKHKYNLSEFSTKWYKMLTQDKMILLKEFVL